jgi:hypothetical protein
LLSNTLVRLVCDHLLAKEGEIVASERSITRFLSGSESSRRGIYSSRRGLRVIT